MIRLHASAVGARGFSHIFACLNGFDHILLVEGVAGRYDDCVDICRGYHILAGLIGLDTILFCNLFTEILVDIRAGNDLCARELLVDPLNVGAADGASTYQPDLQFFHF